MDPMGKDESKILSIPTDSFGLAFCGPRTAYEIQLHPLGSSLPRGSFQGNQRLQRQEEVNLNGGSDSVKVGGCLGGRSL